MSLSRLERMQEMAEEERIAKLRAKMKMDTTDETKRKAKVMDDEMETTRFSVKGVNGCARARRLRAVRRGFYTSAY